ncbi:CotH kinase family protein [Aurantibacillus circumpalustris]|uniref:CotH kinase family protein n=1 Tax=Aurantibacillus circumpalustris TaxID=3036359 RepID=UPI00295A5AE0|nr:CotH kinase family protein [Aurantibacillus circumpalustris]
MTTRKLLLVFVYFFVLCGTSFIFGQSPTYPIVFNEYNVSNVPNGYADEKGALNDYVEIYCNHTASISLQNFYLSNDPNNLKKWKFPNNFPALQPANYYLVWLSGKNTNDGVNFHANFSIEQCKNQKLFLSNGSGTIYDEITIQPTKPGHVRGRVDYDNIGVGAWRLFKTKSPKFANGTPTALGYAPTPEIVLSGLASFTDTAPTNSSSANTGSFLTDGTQIAYILLDGMPYDSTFSCYDVFYTKNGSYPLPFYTNSLDSATDYHLYIGPNNGIVVDATMIIRAIAVPKPNKPSCPINTLPSFCESNTYFIDQEYSDFSKEFGVISIALDKADTAWFASQGAYSASIHVEYYDEKKQMSEGYAIINRPPQEEWRTTQKGFYITKDDRLGSGCNFEGQIFNVEGLGTSSRTVFPTLHLKAGDYESHSPEAAGGGTNVGVSFGTGIRDVVMQSLAAKYDLHVSPLHIKPVVAFVNGSYWGVYDLREVYDKYYEQYYNKQSPDSVDLNFVHNCQEGSVTYWDGGKSKFGANFNSDVYNIILTRPMNNVTDYNRVMNKLDKASFIDYMILNSYGMNSDLFCNNVSLAKGGQLTKPGGKWHFYLWNMPSIFNYTVIAPTGNSFPNAGQSPCYLYNANNSSLLRYTPTLNAFNAHGNVLTRLMSNPGFKEEYIARYQDLLNGPLKCDNILKHFDYVSKLYSKEMKYHEDPASTPKPGKFTTASTIYPWDSIAVDLREVIELRCFYFLNTDGAGFGQKDCYGLTGPYNISVDVRPSESGKVKLNTTTLQNYIWNGKYYGGNMNLKATPASSEYIFHHWEIDGSALKTGFALSMDSVITNFQNNSNIVAVFTDKRNDILNSGDKANVPTGFTPNDDGLNDNFRPLGSAEFATEYQMLIFNRWGQEVFRSVDPFVGWDGRFRGDQAQTGVYAYFITYKNIYNEEKLLKGNVTLTR